MWLWSFSELLELVWFLWFWHHDWRTSVVKHILLLVYLPPLPNPSIHPSIHGWRNQTCFGWRPCQRSRDPRQKTLDPNCPCQSPQWHVGRCRWRKKPLNTPSYITSCNGFNFTFKLISSPNKTSFSKFEATSGKFSENHCCFPPFLWWSDFLERIPRELPFPVPFRRRHIAHVRHDVGQDLQGRNLRFLFLGVRGARMMMENTSHGKGRIFHRWKDDDRIR